MQKILSVLLLSTMSFQGMADVPASQRQEINHLLAFVTQSTCIVNRNGDEHQGPEAASHIRKKYNHFRDDIRTTEDFIRLSATKSTMSGKYYEVQCPDQPSLKTQDWLLAELKAFREQAK